MFMDFITINNDFNNRCCDFSGSEAKLYIVDNDLYKIYYKNNISSIYHLLCLISKQNKLKNTILPNGIIVQNDKLKGIKIPYFKDYKTAYSLINENREYKIEILSIIMNHLKELTDNDIYPMDFNSEGILVKDKDVKIIDLDTYTTYNNKDISREKLIFVHKLYLNIILELMYKDFEPIRDLFNLENYLENKKINKNIIHDITNNNITYGNLSNFIETMKIKL